MGRVLSGKEVAALVRVEVAEQVSALNGQGVGVGLATLLVGDDPASRVYVNSKHKAAAAAGMESIDRTLPATATQAEVLAVIDELNRDPAVTGMIVQLPLPEHLDEEEAVMAVSPNKDADGLHPTNLGSLVLGRAAPRPATPSGIMRLLEHYEIPTVGERAVIVGRSMLVGRPLSLMLGLSGVDATVTVAHSRTRDLPAVTSHADILVVAAGRPGLIGAEHVKPGATVIDVGTTRLEDRLAGDVDFDAVLPIAGGVTPVPGGVGPMTIASLLANTVSLAAGS